MHVIRLRGPWMLEANGQLQPIELPATWQAILQASVGQPFKLIRNFGAPTGIEPGDSVQLVIAGSGVQMAAELNGQMLGVVQAEGGGRFEIAASLQQRNRLVLTAAEVPTSSSAPSHTTIGVVQLEITHAPLVE